MAKIIELTFDDGEKWQMPLEFVAKHRANYYKGRAAEKCEDDFNYEEEVEYVMNDDYEGKDWLQNNMDYEDFKDVVVKLPAQPQDKDWVNAEIEIKETTQ